MTKVRAKTKNIDNTKAKTQKKTTKPKTANKETIEEKSKGGRPTKYHVKYCQQILSFMERQAHQVVVDETYYKIPDKVMIDGYEDGEIILGDMPTGSVKARTNKVISNIFPTIERFAHSIGVHRDTLWERAHGKHDNGKLKHPEFSDAYRRAIQIQEAILNENALQGNYNPGYAMFLAKNKFGYKDKQDMEFSGEVNITVRAILDGITGKKDQ